MLIKPKGLAEISEMSFTLLLFFLEKLNLFITDLRQASNNVSIILQRFFFFLKFCFSSGGSDSETHWRSVRMVKLHFIF